jgi:4-amino-4-deoxy-L-arabinose transferase-like glycosyltransferase
MMNLAQTCLLLIDAFVVLAAAWLVLRMVDTGRLSTAEVFLSWGLLGLMGVVASGVLLAANGHLGLTGFFVSHVGGLVFLALVRRGRLDEDRTALRRIGESIAQTLRAGGVESWLWRLLLAVVLLLGVLAWLAQPVVYDALTYRFSRIGHWLQHGRIGPVTTDDARLNFMPVAPDLVMAWLIGAKAEGFGAAAVGQWLGGLLALGATYTLARMMEVRRAAAIGAALLLLGLPNVAPQFTAAYTDLFTTGVLAAAFTLWLAALQRGEASWVAGAGVALALASKGTVVYFSAGLLPVVGWLAWRYRHGWSAWKRTLAGGALGVAVFLAPSLWRNFQTYGSPEGPPEFVTWHHGQTPGWAGSVEKVRLNLTSALVQLAEPNSQPPWWRQPVAAVGESLLRTLPEKDPFAFDEINRRANLQKIYAVAAPDADISSTGVLLPILGLLAAGAALLTRAGQRRELAMAWAVVIGGFVLFMAWRLQWHPYQFRFLVLATPWLAVLVVWWLDQRARPIRVGLWAILSAVTAYGFGAALLGTYQSGWPAYGRPLQSQGAYVFQQWREWSEHLDRPEIRLRPALPMNLPLAAFYRQPGERQVSPVSLTRLGSAPLEELVRDTEGWLIVPADRYPGKEGAVMGRTWLFDGDEKNAFSVAAYRSLQKGEKARPMIYRNRLIEAGATGRREMLVRTWEAEPLTLEVFNPGQNQCAFRLGVPSGVMTYEIGAGKSLWLEVVLPADQVSLIWLDWPNPTTGPAASLVTRLRF